MSTWHYMKNGAQTGPISTDELKALIGDVFVPTVKVGKQNQRGFDSAAWHNLLDLAGYPKSSGKPGAGK